MRVSVRHRHTPRKEMKTGGPGRGQVPHGAIGDVSDATQRAADMGVDFAEQRAESRACIHVFEDDHAWRRDRLDVLPPLHALARPIPGLHPRLRSRSRVAPGWSRCPPPNPCARGTTTASWETRWEPRPCESVRWRHSPPWEAGWAIGIAPKDR